MSKSTATLRDVLVARIPASFAGFRKTVASIYVKVFGKPAKGSREAALLDILRETDYEGDEVAEVWTYWDELDGELSEAKTPAQRKDVWWFALEEYVHDAIVSHFNLGADESDTYRDALYAAPSKPKTQKPKAAKADVDDIWSKDTDTTFFITELKAGARGTIELHQQKRGNMNYVAVFRSTSGKATIKQGGAVFTVLTKDGNCKREEYAEELDIELDTNHPRGQAEVKRIAQAALDAVYTGGLRISKIVRRW